MVVGNLSNPQENPGGQLVKTQEFLAALERRAAGEVLAMDTSSQRALFFFRMFHKFRTVERVFFLPGRRFLLVVAFLLRGYRFLVGPAPVLHLVAVGGWLPQITRNKLSRWILGVFDSVSPEAVEMAVNLESPTLQVHELPNFRHPSGSLGLVRRVPSTGLRLVFISRINRIKGVFEAIELVHFLRAKDASVSLTVFGPILFEKNSDEELFRSQLLVHASCIRYGGVLTPDSVMATLVDYDCLLFPSTYPGEGFPGIIVESMLTGIPVIAKDHLFLASLNLRYDYGFVTEGSFVEESAEILMARKHVRWQADWELRNRRQDLEKCFGDAAFQEWFGRVLQITAH